MKEAIKILTDRMLRELDLSKISKGANRRGLHFDNYLHIKYAIRVLEAESKQVALPPCPCCGSKKVYLTEAIHCTRCAVTAEF